jgi:3-hydroxyisobutyrate dehydrogenase
VQISKASFYNDLNKTYQKIWELLNLGLKNRNSPFHIPVFICGNENKYDGRIVVLRGINENEKKIWFHSDIRSNKIKNIKYNPSTSLLFYDKSDKVQLRIDGTCKVNYQNETSKNSWKKTAHISRQCYLGIKAPRSNSNIATSGLTKNIDNFNYSIEESETGYKNFCVVEFYINSIEWLYLAAKGHRRALFSLDKKNIEKKWLIP